MWPTRTTLKKEKVISHISYLSILFFILLVSPISATQSNPDVLIRLELSGINPEMDLDNMFVASNQPLTTVVSLLPKNQDQQNISYGVNHIAVDSKINSKIYLVYTKGTIATIDSRMRYVRENTFDKISNPSFGFPMSDKQNVYIGLDYDNINYSNYDSFGAGNHNLIFKNQGIIDTKSLLSIENK